MATLKKRKSLRKNKILSLCSYNFHSTNDMLAEMETQLLMKSPRDTSLSTAPSRPVPLPPCIGRLNVWFLPRGNLAPREQLVIRTSTPQTSNKGTLTNLLKEQQELVESITRDVEEADAELESEYRLLCSNIQR
ncbi:hypothetical protein mRhiFer1_009783 [Rhinolophus ferrumequinum]|uniref:DUF3496 domain-containing protein n=1 Tax=Rhinolophus ferrumequinum TaxID=59479 RepID=A0A7J7ZDL1_RHIFE|nr:hypothetical protein mRhiFer1_009783 [Rhinolophus ferrumequinum]